MNDRQQQLISLLCQRRSDSIQNLAMELGVCERTIRRDIEELTLTYPIETVRGRYGGGVRMADWYFQDRPKLTPKCVSEPSASTLPPSLALSSAWAVPL